MVKQFTKFFGYDLRQGTLIIAVISALISLGIAPLLIYVASVGGDLIAEAEKKNPNVRNYGGSSGFWFATLHTGLQDFVHMIICILLYYGAKCDGGMFVRCWIRSSVVWLCMHGILIPFAATILFAAGATVPAVGALLGLALVFPIKLYFTLVVNSYHNDIAPGHFWGNSLRISNTFSGPRSTQLVPPVTANRPVVLLINEN